MLAGEIEARATRISQASNDQIVLATDGVLRWTGDLVGKLVAGDDTLRPRVRVIADEHLTGPARELVQNAARSLAEDPYRKIAGAAVLADRR